MRRDGELEAESAHVVRIAERALDSSDESLGFDSRQTVCDGQHLGGEGQRGIQLKASGDDIDAIAIAVKQFAILRQRRRDLVFTRQEVPQERVAPEYFLDSLYALRPVPWADQRRKTPEVRSHVARSDDRGHQHAAACGGRHCQSAERFGCCCRSALRR